MLSTLAFILYLTASLGLLLYGLNCHILVFLFRKKSAQTLARQRETERTPLPTQLPEITTQLPIYNEFNVAERAIRAIAAFDYPTHLHQIQVLDDSTDETRDLIDSVAAELRAQGLRIDVIRRPVRTGYKAGALADAMPAATGEFIAIFDADFVPAPDFLRRTLPHFSHENIGLVQARWGHLNRDHSLLTRAQAIGIDGHFAIEQSARRTNQLFLNFNGTAGLWRRTTIEDAGGWMADTLTEDLDLSYRAQLRGWQLEYVPDIVVPAELPETYSAFKSQQFRWAKGSIQTARKLLPEIFRSDQSLFAKIQTVFHLCAYSMHLMMLALALLALPAISLLGDNVSPILFATFAIPMLIAASGPPLLYLASQRALHPADWKQRAALLPVLILLGFGICISNTRAVGEALLGIRSGFIRTPKRGSNTTKSYNTRPDLIPVLEILAAIYCALSLAIYANREIYGILPFLLIYVAGFAWVGISSLREQSHASRP